MDNEAEAKREEHPMPDIKIHVLHTGAVCVSPDPPFGGDRCNPVKASGIFQPRGSRLWLPVSAYLIEHPRGLFLVDTGWARAMSPEGVFDKRAQVKSLGSLVLYEVNQGQVPLGQCVDEQLAAMGMKTSDIDAVLLTHLDCDHANGIVQVKDARRFVVAADEVRFASKITNRVRYNRDWWGMVELDAFEWNDDEGPAGKEQQKASLAWIREQSLDPLCVESLANHDPDIEPHVIEL